MIASVTAVVSHFILHLGLLCHQNNGHSVQVISETEQYDCFGSGEIFLSEPVLDSVLVIDILIF